ncbi:MAG: methyltransferase type 11 [Rhodothermaceae bacterium]|nr:MAG: methyltransferase type 11 [Rhodothermaceae bacterium]
MFHVCSCEVLRRACRYLAVAVLLLAVGQGGCGPAGERRSDGPRYEVRREAGPDGTGRYYMGREIARPLTDADDAGWLERAERESVELPDRLVEALGLKPTDIVADVGAGTGYFTFRLGKKVPYGKVYAVDIDPAMLDTIRTRMAARGVRNVIPVLGEPDDPHLPAGTIDVALIVAAYHEFSHPYEMMQAIVRALKPGGRVVVVEYRGEDATIPLPSLHRMTEAQLRREMTAAGLRWRETREILPWQHFMVFEKPPTPGETGSGGIAPGNLETARR